MALYKHQVNTYHRAKRARGLRKAVYLVVFLAVLGTGALGLDWVIEKYRASQSTVSVESVATVQSSSVNIFRTPYFQFQADRTWRESGQENPTDKKFVYRSYTGQLVQNEIIVEVDPKDDVILANTQVSRVLPVEVSDNTLHATGLISPHCRDFISDKANRIQQLVIFEGTTFPCNPDSEQFVVIVATKDANHTIKKFSDNGVRTFRITYRDSTFSPTGAPLDNIIDSFQLL